MDDTTAASDKAEDGDLLQAFAQLALITVNTDPPEQTLRRVAELAQRTLAGVEDVSLALIEHERPRTVVFTGQLAIDLDERQYEFGFGPCLDAAKTGQTIVVDTRSDVSYPVFVEHAEMFSGYAAVVNNIASYVGATDHRAGQRGLGTRLADRSAPGRGRERGPTR
jgi:hypothetical protein